MAFNSIHFAGFFILVYALYRALPHRWQNWLLLVASYYFYAAWDWRFVGLLASSTIVSYVCALYIGAAGQPRRRRAALIASLSFNLGVLAFFKYFNFFAENLHALFAAAGFRLDVVTLRVALPIGISFYTFIAIGYVIDVYRRQAEPERNLRDFALFIAYFPHLVAGPILRASAVLPQIASPRRVTRDQVVEGLWLIGYGFFKKVFVADNLAVLVDRVFAASQPGSLEVLFGVYAFAFQIYGDFSGYTDIARGTSKLLGIELCLNFRFPYFVRTPQQFWQHWHISLSAWLRDYVFLPLSFVFSRRLDGVGWLGLRDDFWIYASATMITMLLGGLWHGAAWTFVAWGAYQGALLVGFTAAEGWRRKAGRKRRRSVGPLRVLWMFHLTCAGWLIFRADSLAHAASLARALVTGGLAGAALSDVGLPLLFYAGPLVAVLALEASRDDLFAVPTLPPLFRYSVYVAMFYLIVLFGDFGGSQFIYFQF